MNSGNGFSLENLGFLEKPIDSVCLPGNHWEVEKDQMVS